MQNIRFLTTLILLCLGLVGSSHTPPNSGHGWCEDFWSWKTGHLTGNVLEDNRLIQNTAMAYQSSDVTIISDWTVYHTNKVDGGWVTNIDFNRHRFRTANNQNY